jgi:hypothetical protein
MAELSPRILIDSGLKPWNVHSTGDDPQVRHMAQNWTMDARFGMRMLGTIHHMHITTPDSDHLLTLGNPLTSTREAGMKGREVQPSVEMEWLTTHAEELSQYPGEWLLLSGRGLVGHSRDIAEIRRLVALHGLRKPFLHYVPTAEEANFIF